MRSGAIVMISGGAIALLGGVFMWRGWARWCDCEKNPPTDYDVCELLNAPMVTGMILAPVGMASLVLGGAVALIQQGER